MREKRRCDFCEKNDYYTPYEFRYVIWVTGPLKNYDGSLTKDENGNLIISRINVIDSKEELKNQPEAIEYVKKHVKLKENQDIEFDKIKIYRNLWCPSCRRTQTLYKSNLAKSNAKRKKEGIRLLTPIEAANEAVQQIQYKIAEEKKIKEALENSTQRA